MQDAGVSFLSTWQTFYVIIGSAAATLTGLMFVVATLIAGVRVRVSSPGEAFATFNTPNVVHFCLALLVAAILSAPWQALWNAVLLLGLLGLGPLVSYTALLVAAIALPGYPAPALFAIAAGTVLLLFIGIHNAWDNVIFIALELSRPQNKSQD
jgi:hypothetical protein